MESNLRKMSMVVVILLLLLLISSFVHAEDRIENNKVYVVIVNRLCLNDIEIMYNLKSIIAEGSIGLMNPRGLTGYKGAEGYMTINTSAKAHSSYEAANSFNLDKDTLPVYERRLGKIQGEYQVANIEINKLKSLNIKNAYNPIIGALGDNLHNNGQKTAVFGNSDTADSFVRTNCLIAIDSKGLIDFGNVDNILTRAEDYPFGLKTNYENILSGLRNVMTEASLFIIETGDLNRLNQYSEHLSDIRFLEHREKILTDIDDFIGNIFREIKHKNSMLIIISPNSPENRLDISMLSPLIIWNSEKSNGILTSDTTRRKGIVTNLDIAPTITNFLKANNEYFVGNIINVLNFDDNLDYIKQLNTRTNVISKLRSPYLKFYSLISIFIITIGMFTLLIKGKYINKIKIIVKYLLLAILLLPLIFLLISFINIENSFAFFVFTLLFLFIIIAIMYFIHDKYKILVLFTTIQISLIIDILLGGNLLKYSILSYDPVIGARYFGIGNEFVGIMLPVMILMTALYMEKAKGNTIFLIILPITVLIVSHPNLGANFGGTIAIILTSMIYIIYLYKIRLDLKKIIFIGIILTLIFVILGLIDINVNTNPTHLGSTLLLIFNKGPKSLIDIIFRKVQMNIKLMKSSIWSKVLIITILSEFCLIIKYKKKIQNILIEYKYFSAGIVSAVLGSIIGLLLNDSGVLLAAISNTYIASTLIYLLFDTIIDT